jgi:glycosyltransferase involved in cell wall biosynthesis
VRIAFYCPNKPLTHPDPSGDLTIAGGIREALNENGHDCREIVQFRSRWFWKSPQGRVEALKRLIGAYANALKFRPHIWLTYHTYYKSPDVIGPLISRSLRAPYVLFQPMYGTKRRKDADTRIGFYLNRLALKTCRHAFVNNIRDIEALGRAGLGRRITYIPPGIFPECFQRDEEAGALIRELHGIPGNVPVLLTAAMFRPGVKFQSLVYLFHSLALLKERNQPFVLMVAGSGPMYHEVQAIAERLLTGCVIFAGQVPRREMPGYYSASDLFVFPGIGESLGMVYLEAQACGLPVVALDTAGVPQVVLKDRTGILVPQDDGRSLAEAVEKLVKEPGLRKELGQKAIEHIRTERNLHKNYSMLARKLESIVESA